MRRKAYSIGMVVIVGIALWVLVDAKASFMDLLLHPLRSLWGSQEQVRIGIIEVSENLEPASRQLLKPLGTVTLIQTFAVSSSSPTVH